MGGGSFHGQGVVSGAGVVSVAGGRQERPRVSKIAQEWPSGEGLEFSVFGRSKMNTSSGPDLPNPPLGDDSMGGESFHGRGVVPWARGPSMGEGGSNPGRFFWGVIFGP